MTRPAMTFVDSSNVEAIGFDPIGQELYVQFRSGRTYVYIDVPEATYDELMNSDSKGSYISREIRPNYQWRDE